MRVEFLLHLSFLQFFKFLHIAYSGKQRWSIYFFISVLPGDGGGRWAAGVGSVLRGVPQRGRMWVFLNWFFKQSMQQQDMGNSFFEDAETYSFPNWWWERWGEEKVGGRRREKERGKTHKKRVKRHLFFLAAAYLLFYMGNCLATLWGEVEM